MAWQTPKIDWATWDVPAASDFNRIEGNVDTIWKTGKVLPATGTNIITVSTGAGFEYTQGNPLKFRAAGNSTGAVTVNIDGKGAKPLKKLDGTNASVKAGKVYEIYFDVTGDCFFVLARAEGNATAADVLAGKIFSNDDDTGITGTMTNNEAVIITPSTENISIVKGYHDGSGYVKGDANLIAANIVKNKSIFGIDGSFDGKKWASGTVTSPKTGGTNFTDLNGRSFSGQKITVTGLTFKASYIIAKNTTFGANYFTIYDVGKYLYNTNGDIFDFLNGMGHSFDSENNTYGFSISDTGFVLPAYADGDVYSWFAVE